MTPADPVTGVVPVTLTARYSGHLAEDGRLYRPCRLAFQLPEAVEVPTVLSLNAFKPDPASADSTIGIKVTDADGAPVTAGRVELSAPGGRFLDSGDNRSRIAINQEKQFVVWRQPAAMKNRLTIQAVYQPEATKPVQYLPCRAVIDLPVVFPRDTRIETAVVPIDRDANSWAITAAVSAVTGEPVSTGTMRVEASVGRVETPADGNLINLAETPQPRFRWQGAEGATAAVVLTYYGDGLAPDSGNRDFRGAMANLTVPPEPDTRAPVILFTGVRDGMVSPGPVTVRVRVTDDMSASLDIHAFHSANDQPAVPFPALRPIAGANAYSGAGTFRAEGRHVIDVLAMDAAGNHNREIVAFRIVPPEEPEAPEAPAETKEPPDDNTGGGRDTNGGRSDGDSGNPSRPSPPPVFSPYGGMYR